MPDLFLHKRRIKTVFDLLGSKENDITFSVGWGLAQCNVFLALLIERLFPGCNPGATTAIYLQEHGEDRGYTDIEVLTECIHIVIEAKCGWNLPSDAQLGRYAPRFIGNPAGSAIVVIAECTEIYARGRLPATVRGISVRYLSWKEVAQIVSEGVNRSRKHAEKRLLLELRVYLEEVMSIQNQESNMVYVVALGADKPQCSTLSWREFVTERSRYFHPFDKRYPKQPPNYLGFYYDGRLQSIHHVRAYTVVTGADELAAHIPEVNPEKWRELDRFPDRRHFLYTLGPAIVPSREVRLGGIYPGARVWAAIDLLLTCHTISEARDLTKERLSNEM